MNWNEKVKEALERTEFMAISTLNPDGTSWTNPVAFGYGPAPERDQTGVVWQPTGARLVPPR